MHYAKGHRYGFNGKEKDEDGEWGSNTHYDYGFRIYNPAIAKFLFVDPLTKSYPMLTSYQFASNTPIQAIDLDGLEKKIVVLEHIFQDGELTIVNEVTLYRDAQDGLQQVACYSFDQYDQRGEIGSHGTLHVYHDMNLDVTETRHEETWKDYAYNLQELYLTNASDGAAFTATASKLIGNKENEKKTNPAAPITDIDVLSENPKQLGSTTKISKAFNLSMTKIDDAVAGGGGGSLSIRCCKKSC